MDTKLFTQHTQSIYDCAHQKRVLMGFLYSSIADMSVYPARRQCNVIDVKIGHGKRKQLK